MNVKNMMVVVALLVVTVSTSALEETWTRRTLLDGNGKPTSTVVWRSDYQSPAFEISGIYAEDGRIEIRGIRGYYSKNEVSIMGVSWSDAKNAFLITYHLKKEDSVRAFFLEVQQTGFAEYAKKVAQKAYPEAKLGDHPVVVWDSGSPNGISLELEPFPDDTVVKR